MENLNLVLIEATVKQYIETCLEVAFLNEKMQENFLLMKKYSAALLDSYDTAEAAYSILKEMDIECDLLEKLENKISEHEELKNRSIH
jgi:hypothetical protein